MSDVRIVSLVPSVTESLRAWGRDPLACTRFCEQPDLATVGGTKDPDVAAIVELAPDLVIVDTEENRRDDHDALVSAGLAVHVLSVTSVDGAIAQMTELAARLGVDWRPRPPQRVGRPVARAFVPIWRRPWMSIGGRTYGSDLLAAAGVVNVLADVDAAYPTVELEEVAALAPELVLAPSEPYEFGERHRPELATVAPTVFVDGRDLFWWGVRTAGALTRLAELAAASTVRP